MVNLYSVLSDASAVTALAGTRIYPASWPEGQPIVLPGIVWHTISAPATPTLNTMPTQKSRIQIDCIGESFEDAVTLRTAVIQALAGYRDANFSAQILSTSEDFTHELTQYFAVVEIYTFSSL